MLLKIAMLPIGGLSRRRTSTPRVFAAAFADRLGGMIVRGGNAKGVPRVVVRPHYIKCLNASYLTRMFQ
jgi:hypothetical protein